MIEFNQEIWNPGISHSYRIKNSRINPIALYDTIPDGHIEYLRRISTINIHYPISASSIHLKEEPIQHNIPRLQHKTLFLSIVKNYRFLFQKQDSSLLRSELLNGIVRSIWSLVKFPAKSLTTSLALALVIAFLTELNPQGPG